MSIHALFTQESYTSSDGRLPTKRTTSPISPAYAQVLRNVYNGSDYSLFFPAPSCSKTSTLSKAQCKANGKRQRPVEAVRPWRGEREVNMGLFVDVYTTTSWGITPRKKMEKHKAPENLHPNCQSLPECLRRNGVCSENHLHPRWGDLKSTGSKDGRRVYILPTQIEEHLHRIQVERKAKRDSLRGYIGHQRMREIIETNEIKEEERPRELSFMGGLPGKFRLVWTWMCRAIYRRESKDEHEVLA